MRNQQDLLTMARERLASARSVVVLTGAGISAESGIATFRGGMDALWKDFDPQTLATPQAFERDPEMVTRWYDWRRLKCLDAAPNRGHLALAALEDRLSAQGGRFTLLTQNVDRLHQRAGSRCVVELHGTIMEWRCCRTGKPVPTPSGAWGSFPPASPHAAGALVRPSVVWFGEALPEAALVTAMDVSRSCDVFMSIGTSAVVYPAAGFIKIAADNGAFTIEVNRDPTPISSGVDCALHGLAGELLPRLVS